MAGNIKMAGKNPDGEEIEVAGKHSLTRSTSAALFLFFVCSRLIVVGLLLFLAVVVIQSVSYVHHRLHVGPVLRAVVKLFRLHAKVPLTEPALAVVPLAVVPVIGHYYLYQSVLTLFFIRKPWKKSSNLK